LFNDINSWVISTQIEPWGAGDIVIHRSPIKGNPIYAIVCATKYARNPTDGRSISNIFGLVALTQSQPSYSEDEDFRNLRSIYVRGSALRRILPEDIGYFDTDQIVRITKRLQAIAYKYNLVIDTGLIKNIWLSAR